MLSALVLPIIGVLLLGKETSSLKSMEIKVPEAARVGDTVTLKCEYDLETVPLYSIKWYWNDQEFYRYIPKESPPRKAFGINTPVAVDMTKSDANSVTIINLHRGQTGDYKCEVTSDAPRFHNDMLMSHMTVVDIPQGDPIMRRLDPKTEAGKTVNIECIQSGSYPAANFTWFINGNKVHTNSSNITIHPTQVDLDNALDRRTAKSRITILTSKPQFIQGGMTVQCEASIYKLWRGIAEDAIRDEAPKLAQVLGSTQSQSQMDPSFEPGNSARWTSSISNMTMFFCLLSSILKVVFR